MLGEVRCIRHGIYVDISYNGYIYKVSLRVVDDVKMYLKLNSRSV